MKKSLIKYVKEACGTVYLAVLKAIDEHLISKGVNLKDSCKGIY
jgi:hypothetical protein